MSEIPENLDLQWIARHLIDFRQETRDEMRVLRSDMDMLIRLLSQGDLRRRLEALERR